MSHLSLKNPLILALDVSTWDEARHWVKLLGSLVGAIKIGPRLLLRANSSWVKDLAEVAPLFIDCKFFDIPSTMVASVEACYELGASIVTVHSLAGQEALEKLSGLEKKIQNTKPFLITPVTILTSQSEENRLSVFKEESIEQQVQQLSQLVVDVGLSSLVCSPHEASFVSKKGLLPITPGVRVESKNLLNSTDDQKRIMTPQRAIQEGAWAFVMGRPILESQNPQSFVKSLLEFI